MVSDVPDQSPCGIDFDLRDRKSAEPPIRRVIKIIETKSHLAVFRLVTTAGSRVASISVGALRSTTASRGSPSFKQKIVESSYVRLHLRHRFMTTLFLGVST